VGVFVSVSVFTGIVEGVEVMVVKEEEEERLNLPSVSVELWV
jgi:hypothetical protein